MARTRSVVITGASRGLGLASANDSTTKGWTVVAAMRSVEVGLKHLRAATGAVDGDDRLIGVQLDLTDPVSVEAAARVDSRSGRRAKCVGPQRGNISRWNG